jgi:hypothetical protein
MDSYSESGEESNKISKENEITAEEVVAAPLAFATSSKTAFIQRADLAEFNRALDYISLIKNHFASSPEVYQQFIRIVNSTKDQKDQDHIGAILDEVALLFDTQAKLMEGFVYFLPKQLQSWAKAKIEGKICMAQMIHIPEYIAAAEEEADDNVRAAEEEADDSVDHSKVLFPHTDGIGEAVTIPDTGIPINEDAPVDQAPFPYPYAMGVDYTDENIKHHVNAFYKLVLPIFYLQGCTAKLIEREKYEEIKTTLLRHYCRDSFATLKKEGFLVIHHWKKIYALVITGDDNDDGNVLLVAHSTELSAD